MDTTRNLPQKITYSPLSNALRKDDQSIAIRELGGLTISKIMNTREMHEDLTFQLEALRKSYRFINKMEETSFAIPYKDGDQQKEKIVTKQEMLDNITKLGDEVKAKLDLIPAMPNLFELRSMDEMELVRVVSLLIVNLIEFFNVSEIMGEVMIKEVALRIAFQFGGLTLEDVALCFDQAKSGLHGKIYNRIDGAVLMDWLRRYERDVQELGQERNRRIHNQGKAGVWKEGHEYRIIEPKNINELT